MGVKAIDAKLCNGCGICVQDCPTDVFKIDDATGKAYIAYPEDCADCKLCPTTMCPAGAIEYSLNTSDKFFFPYDIGNLPIRRRAIFKEKEYDSRRNRAPVGSKSRKRNG